MLTEIKEDKLNSQINDDRINTSKEQIIERLSKAQNITITGHRNPDCDCICSGLALSLIIKKLI